MNKKTLTYVGIGLVVAVGGYFAYTKFFKKDSTESTAESTPESTENKNGLVGGNKGSLPPKMRKGISDSANSFITPKTIESVVVSTESSNKDDNTQLGVDPRIDQAVANRKEAERLRKAKGVKDVAWGLQLQGMHLNLNQRLFMRFMGNNATSDEKLSASIKALEWAKNR